MKSTRNNRRIVAWLGLAGVMSASAAGVFWFASHAGSEATGAAVRGSEQGASTLVNYGWREGALLSYRVHSELAQTSAASAHPPMTIDAVWHVKILAVNADVVHAATSLEEVVVKQGTTRATLVEQALTARRAFLELAPNGVVRRVHVPAELPTTDAAMLRELNTVEVALPSDLGKRRAGSSWVHTEATPSATAQVKYTAVNAKTIVKERTRYTATDAQSGSFELKIASSKYTARLGPIWLDHYAGEEELAVTGAGKTITSLVSRISLERIERPPVPALATVSAAEMAEALRTSHAAVQAAAPGKSAWEREQRKRLQEAYADVPLQAALDHLRQTVASAERHVDTIDATRALSDWLLAKPGRPAELARALSSGNHDPGLSARMIHALELASSEPEAQAALAQLVRDQSLPDHLREQALVAAAGVDGQASDELRDTLLVAALDPDDQGLGVNPLLNLGALAENDPAAATALEQHFGPLLQPGSGARDEQLQATLDAFTNAKLGGDDHVRHALALQKDHSSAEVRAAALEYLSAVGGAPPSIYVEALRDPSRPVQQAALDALFREQALSRETIVAILGHAAQPATSDAIRLKILRGTSQQGGATAFADQLGAIASASSSGSVKEMVKAVLEGRSLVEKDG